MRFRLFVYGKFLCLVLLFAMFFMQTASAQKITTLSFDNVIIALQATTGNFTPEELIKYIITRVKVLGVNFKLSPANENTLIEAGATSELIEVIRQESLRINLSRDEIAAANDFYNLGLEYYNALNYDQAIENFQKAIDINPRLGLAYGGLGLAYYEKKDYEQSIEYYSKAIAANPAPALYINRGVSYHAAKNYDKAAQDFTQVIQTQPTNKKAYFNRGAAYFSNNQFDKAIPDFEKVLELDPKYPNAEKKLDLCKTQQAKKESQ